VIESPVLAATLPYIESKYFNRDVDRNAIDWIVLHCMASPETPQRAEQCARYMQTLSEVDHDGKPIKKSAHYYGDCDSFVQGVPDNRIAYHAPGCNERGIGIEHAGQAFQTREQWLDDFGIQMLSLSAQLTARLVAKWNVPIVYVDAAGLLAKQRGITVHAEVTKAFKRSTHTDPGEGFPIDWYLETVRFFATK